MSLTDFRFINAPCLDYKDIDNYMSMEYVEVKNTKTFLNKILKLSSSKYNEDKKKDVVDFIYNISNEEGNLVRVFGTGGFVDNSRNKGCSYVIIKNDNEVRLVVGTTVYKLV